MDTAYQPRLMNCLIMDESTPSVIETYGVMGYPLPTITPVITTVLWCVLFVGIAI